MPGLVSTSLGAAAVVLFTASLFLPQAFGTTSLLPSLGFGSPKTYPPRSKDPQEDSDSLACSRKRRATKVERARQTKHGGLAEESTENRENGNEKENDEGDKGGPMEEAAEGQEDEPALEEEPGRTDGVIIIGVLVIEFWFRVPVAEAQVPVEEGAEELEIIRYWTLALDILAICNHSIHERYLQFSDSDGRCRWH